jgi:hypothetical protein
MRRSRLIISFLLFALAIALPTLIVPAWERLPFFWRGTTDLEGEVTLLQEFQIELSKFPLAIRMEAHTVGTHGQEAQIRSETHLTTALSEQDALTQAAIKMFLKYVVVDQQYWDKIELVFGDQKIESEYSVDRTSGVYTSPGDRQGKQWMFPLFRVQPIDYTFWESNTKSPLVMQFRGEELYRGLRVYRYVGEVGRYTIGQVTIPWIDKTITLRSDGALTVLVDHETGLSVWTDFNFKAYAQWFLLHFDILEITFQPTTQEADQQVANAKLVLSLRQCGRVWVPLVVGVIGAGLLGWDVRRKLVSKAKKERMVN